MVKNKKLTAALLFPILCLLLLTAYKAIKVASGTEVTIPIIGYDPRDLLSGHYLIFRLDFNNNYICSDYIGGDDPVYLCLDKNEDSTVSARAIECYEIDGYRNECTAILRGSCSSGRFTAGIERFYIPEKHSRELDRIIRMGQGKLVVSIDWNGRAVIKDLLINDRPWREFINKKK